MGFRIFKTTYTDRAGKEAPMPQLESDDFYLENGLLVFTATFHLKRGSCCGNRCRHCPYSHENVDVVAPSGTTDVDR